MRTNRVRDVRLAHKLTRAEFAERIGYSARAVSYWETGARPITAAVLSAIESGLCARSVPSGDLMRRARRLAHITQRQAATLLGTTQRHWQAWETERARMPALKWALFLRLTKLPADLTLDYDPMRSTRGLYR